MHIGDTPGQAWKINGNTAPKLYDTRPDSPSGSPTPPVSAAGDSNVSSGRVIWQFGCILIKFHFSWLNTEILFKIRQKRFYNKTKKSWSTTDKLLSQRMTKRLGLLINVYMRSLTLNIHGFFCPSPTPHIKNNSCHPVFFSSPPNKTLSFREISPGKPP